jgi:hypothetical protein
VKRVLNNRFKRSRIGDLPQEVATEARAPRPRSWEGEIGWLFDEIQNLVEPIKRRTMDGPAGPQRGRTPKRRGPTSPADGEESMIWIKCLRFILAQRVAQL